jgi:hypothetical protein
VSVLFAAAWGAVVLGGESALGVATAVFASATVVSIAVATTALTLMIAVRQAPQGLTAPASAFQERQRSASLVER